MLGLLLLDPTAIAADDVDEFVDRLGRRDIALDDVLAAVQGDAVRAGTNVAIVSIGHFAGTVHDAAHDADLDTLQVVCLGSDQRCGLLKVKQGSAA